MVILLRATPPVPTGARKRQASPFPISCASGSKKSSIFSSRCCPSDWYSGSRKNVAKKDSQGFGDVGPQQLLFTLPSGAIRWRTVEDALLYLDNDHITEYGAQLILRELTPILK